MLYENSISFKFDTYPTLKEHDLDMVLAGARIATSVTIRLGQGHYVTTRLGAVAATITSYDPSPHCCSTINYVFLIDRSLSAFIFKYIWLMIKILIILVCGFCCSRVCNRRVEKLIKKPGCTKQAKAKLHYHPTQSNATRILQYVNWGAN